MSNLQYSAHADQRISQRGIACSSVDLITYIGTEVEGGYLVREKDFQMFEREMKQLRDQVRRLVGKRIVIENGRVITVYHANEGKQCRLLRHAREDVFEAS